MGCVAGAGSKKPTLLQNVTIIYDSGTDAETFRKYTTTSQGNLVKALEQGGIDGVRLFNSDSVVTPWDMVYQSNSSYIADSQGTRSMPRCSHSSSLLCLFNTRNVENVSISVRRQ